MVPELVEGSKGRRGRGETYRGKKSIAGCRAALSHSAMPRQRISFREVVGSLIIIQRLTLHLVVPPPRLRCLDRPVSPGNASRWPASEAGETPAFPGITRRDYPRVCGGNGRRSLRCSTWRGLSPRVRGKLGHFAVPQERPRTIPACAGETKRPSSPSPGRWDYPRVCGGNVTSIVRALIGVRLSPRVRGKLEGEARRIDGHGTIPACAGETLPIFRNGCTVPSED